MVTSNLWHDGFMLSHSSIFMYKVMSCFQFYNIKIKIPTKNSSLYSGFLGLCFMDLLLATCYANSCKSRIRLVFLRTKRRGGHLEHVESPCCRGPGPWESSQVGGGDARVSLVILLPWQPCTGLVAKKRMDGSFEVESLSAHDISSDWKYEN